MPIRFSMPSSDNLEPPGDGDGRTALRRQLAPHHTPSLIALPPGEEMTPRPRRGRLLRVLAVALAGATVLGIALFSFGMKYEAHTAPGLVDLVDPTPARPESPTVSIQTAEGAGAASVAQNTYFVHIGPYRDRAEILTAYLELRKLGFEATLVPGDDGARLQILHTADEREARRVARKLFDRGYSPAVFGTDPPAAMLRSMRAATVQYGPVGIKVGFEGGQTAGWSPRGTAIGSRNSALYASDGTRSLEVLLQNTSSTAAAQIRNGQLSVVLPGDRFTVRVLQPVWWARPVTAFLFVIDAEKRVYRDIAVPLEPGRWVELTHNISQQATLPLKEVGIQFGGDLPYTGPIYVDEMEQRRPVP